MELEKLEVYQISMALAEKIWEIVKSWSFLIKIPSVSNWSGRRIPCRPISAKDTADIILMTQRISCFLPVALSMKPKSG